MKKYYKYELNMLIANILSIVMFIVPIIILAILKFDFYSSNSGLFLLELILYFIIHELLHGLGFLIFAKNKKNIKFGITLEKGVLFAACQEKINKKAALISIALPLVVLTFITFPIGILFKLPNLVSLSILNFGGAIGDILMFILILRAPSDVEYIDYNTDIGCYLISENNLENYTSFGFKLTEHGKESDKRIDESIKRLYVSKTSAIILGVLIIISILEIII